LVGAESQQCPLHVISRCHVLNFTFVDTVSRTGILR
jgi:hypothetical protein